jgi:hypothetical protein
MALPDDLNSAATLCANAAAATTIQLIGLGARPIDPAAATKWDRQDTQLKNNISELNNLSSGISASIVSNALQAIWPNLQTLSVVTASAQADITAIKDISEAMSKIASIITFGVAVVTLAGAPTPANAQAVVTAFTKMTAS